MFLKAATVTISKDVFSAVILIKKVFAKFGKNRE
jgi:hypothetical protein